MTGDGINTYTWDAEGRREEPGSGIRGSGLGKQIPINSHQSKISNPENALGQAVQRLSTSPARNFQELFGAGGEELGEYNATPATFW